MDSKDSCSFATLSVLICYKTGELLTRNFLLMFILQVPPSCLCFCCRGMHPIFVFDWSDRSDTSDSQKGTTIQILSDFLQPVIVNTASSCKVSCFAPSNNMLYW
jgi:hypothetical protein